MVRLFLKGRYARDGVIAAIIFIAYFATAKIGLSLDPVSGFATLVWPPTGIALVALFLFGWRFAPSIFLGAFLVNLSTGAPWASAIGIGVGNMSEALLGAMLLHGGGFDPKLERTRDVLRLFWLGAVLSPVVSATIGVASLRLGGVVMPGSAGATWAAWWMGDLLGAFLVGGLLFVWSAVRLRVKNVIEALILMLVSIGISLVVFWDILGLNLQSFPISYMVFIPLIWSALRLGQQATMTVIAVTAVTAVVATALHLGPFAASMLRVGLWNLQVFIGSLAITATLLGAQVNERKRAARALEAAKLMDEAIIASIGEGLVVTDSRGKIMRINPAFEEMFGWSAGEAVGENLSDLIPAQNAAGQSVQFGARVLAHVLAGEKVVTSLPAPLYYFVRKNKTRFPVRIVATPIRRDHELLGAVETFHDITKEAEIDRAKSEFISLASHQLRTPLTIISWHAERMGKKAQALDAEGKKYLAEIRQAAGRMGELVGALLNASRIELGTFRMDPVSVNPVRAAEAALGELLPEIRGKNLAVRKHFGNVPANIHTDPKLLEIILQNLLSNAVHYTPAGGAIDIELETRGANLAFVVRDTGYGIPAADQAKIFTKLFRADNIRQYRPDGTGLGLYLAKAVIGQMRGSISFSSAEGAGTAFTALIPMAPPAPDGDEMKTEKI